MEGDYIEPHRESTDREEGGLRTEPRGWRNEEERSKEDGEGAAIREEKDQRRARREWTQKKTIHRVQSC